MLRLNDRCNRWFDGLPPNQRTLTFLAIAAVPLVIGIVIGLATGVPVALAQIPILVVVALLRLHYLTPR